MYGATTARHTVKNSSNISGYILRELFPLSFSQQKVTKWTKISHSLIALTWTWLHLHYTIEISDLLFQECPKQGC